MVGQTGARFGGAAGRRSRAPAEPPPDDDVAEIQPGRVDQLGQTGARFPSLLGRLRRKPDELDQQQPADDHDHPVAEVTSPPVVQVTSAHSPADQQPESAPPVVEPGEADGPDWDRSKETYDLVRPYFWTGGRTASRVDLAIETLVSATGRPPDPSAPPEHDMILRLCAIPQSVAELAAVLSMPLGVARVVLGDLAATGSVAVHRTVGSADTAPDVALMQRVLAGLQRL
ncbi:MAG: DUF742 domain-containing protein [Pseudonocardiaceae bacterium]